MRLLNHYYLIIIIIIIIIFNFFLYNQQSEYEAKCRSNTITMHSLCPHLLVVLDQISNFVFEITATQSIRRKMTNLDMIT